MFSGLTYIFIVLSFVFRNAFLILKLLFKILYYSFSLLKSSLCVIYFYLKFTLWMRFFFCLLICVSNTIYCTVYLHHTSFCTFIMYLIIVNLFHFGHFHLFFWSVYSCASKTSLIIVVLYHLKEISPLIKVFIRMFLEILD